MSIPKLETFSDKILPPHWNSYHGICAGSLRGNSSLQVHMPIHMYRTVSIHMYRNIHMWRWWNSSWAISNPERWCCESAALNMPANLENSAVAQDWKRSVFIPIPKESNAKECSNYCTIALISHTIKVMLTILQARL